MYLEPRDTRIRLEPLFLLLERHGGRLRSYKGYIRHIAKLIQTGVPFDRQ